MTPMTLDPHGPFKRDPLRPALIRIANQRAHGRSRFWLFWLHPVARPRR